MQGVHTISDGPWVAKRLGPNDVWLNWRGYTGTGYVQTLPVDWCKNPDYLASDNFESFAVEQGWHKPGTGPFNVIGVYCRDRSGEPSAVQASKVEAAVRAAAPKVDVPLLMEQLHMSGRDSSGYGQVAHLRAEIHSDLRTLWVAPGPPITAAFIPWRIGVESVLPEYRRHRYLTAGEAELSNIQRAQQGLESTRYVNRAVKRLLSPAPFILKGEGWYVTDYPSEARKKAKEAETPKAATKPADSKPAESKPAESKPAESSGAKGAASPAAPAKSD